MAPRRMASIRGVAPSPAANANQGNTGVQEEPEQSEPVDPTSLIASWKMFANENAGERLLAGVMNECVPEPVSADNLRYEVKLMSDDQKALLENNRVRILNYLISKVHNSKISLNYVVTKTQKGKRMFTTREKFDAINQNHAEVVAALSENFNIELA